MEKYSVKTILFSPTGTSRAVAQSVINGITENAQIIDSTHKPVAESFDQNDIVVMAAPVYGGHMPPIVKERWENIKGDNTPAVIIGIYGNRNFEKAVIDMADFASERGFVPIAAATFIGEHSYSTTTCPIATGRPDKADIAKAHEFGQAIRCKLKNGNITGIDAASLPMPHTSDESIAAFKNFVSEYQKNRQANPAKPVPDTDFDLCNDCGACIDACPVNAISADGKTTDTTKCIKCCACVKICPTGAKTFASPFAPILSEHFSLRREPVYII